MRPGTWLMPPLLALAVILLAGGLQVSGQTSPETPPAPGQSRAQSPSRIPSGPGGIAFWRDDGIYYLSPGSEKPVRLRSGRSPALSPDGKRVVFCAEAKQPDAKGQAGVEASGPGLILLDLATGKETTILKAEGQEVIRAPVWSPDSDRLAFVARTGLKGQLGLIQSDGSGRRALFSQGDENTLGLILGLVWAAEGKSLWFHDLHDLYRVSDAGVLLSKTPLIGIMGKTSPEAGIIVSGEERFVPNPAGPQLIAFTKTVKASRAYEKAFADDLPGISALFLYDSRTKTRTRLTPKDMFASHPCWSRDGQYLYFSGYRRPHYKEEEPFRIYRVRRNGQGLLEITRGRDPSL